MSSCPVSRPRGEPRPSMGHMATRPATKATVVEIASVQAWATCPASGCWGWGCCPQGWGRAGKRRQGRGRQQTAVGLLRPPSRSSVVTVTSAEGSSLGECAGLRHLVSSLINQLERGGGSSVLGKTTAVDVLFGELQLRQRAPRTGRSRARTCSLPASTCPAMLFFFFFLRKLTSN